MEKKANFNENPGTISFAEPGAECAQELLVQPISTSLEYIKDNLYRLNDHLYLLRRISDNVLPTRYAEQPETAQKTDSSMSPKLSVAEELENINRYLGNLISEINDTTNTLNAYL